MSYPVWPETLRRIERDSWQAQRQDARLRRQSDAGPQTYRRRFSSAARLVALSVIVTRDEKAIFDRFFEQDCQDGTSLFWMPDPTTDGWAALTTGGQRITMPDGTPILMSRRWLCSWGDALPVETVQGDVDFRKSFSVQVMP